MYRIFYYAIIVSTVILSPGCQTKKKSTSDSFELGVSRGEVSLSLKEASGIAASKSNPEYLWVINDSGNPADVYLIDKKASTRLVLHLAGVSNRDFEDIIVAQESSGKNYIYVGDIGDNLAQYKYKYIYRFPEPDLNDTINEMMITQIDKLTIQLPDGIRDVETLMIDPPTRNLYLVSKRESKVRLYKVVHPFEKDTVMAEKIAVLPLQNIVSGSISPDGNEVLLKNYYDIYYWKKTDRESIDSLLLKYPKTLHYWPELLGEAITWSYDGSGYYTLSEMRKKRLGKLMYYKRRNPPRD